MKEKPECGAILSEDKEDRCPECGFPLWIKWSGVECSECDYWFCY